jgi:hypothetical protein
MFEDGTAGLDEMDLCEENSLVTSMNGEGGVGFNPNSAVIYKRFSDGRKPPQAPLVS